MESQVHPPSSSPVRKKARRSARVARRAGPSGWKHADAGDERDLVPPSDDEEFEAWQRDKQARQIVVPAKASEILTDRRRDDLSPSPSSRATSPTLPLTLSDVFSEPHGSQSFVDDARESDGVGSDRLDVMGDDAWPTLFSSPIREKAGIGVQPLSPLESQIPIYPALLSPASAPDGQEAESREEESPLRPHQSRAPSPHITPPHTRHANPSPSLRNLPSPSPIEALDAIEAELSPPLDATHDATPPDVLPSQERIALVQPVVDPELQKFRTARTFRTRTTLQLQPYTRERLMYEAALRKGGLRNGKRAVARPKEIASSESEDVQQESSSSLSSPEEDPERIVIGGTFEDTRPPRRQRAPIPILPADQDEYLLKYGTTAIEGDDECEQRLQQLAKERIRNTKMERRMAREAAKQRKEFEAMLKEANGIATPEPRSKGLVEAASEQTGKPKRTGDRVVYDRIRRPALDPLPSNGQSESTQRPSRALSGEDEDELRLGGSEMDMGMPEFGADYGFPSPSQGDSHSPARTISSGASIPRARSSTPPDPRERIARRMMPAVMLKRLQREDKEKKSRRDGNRAPDKHISENRPGKAIIKHGQAHRTSVDLGDFFESEAESSLAPTPSDNPSSRSQNWISPSGSAQYDTDSTDGSQAREDNGRRPALRRLIEGDFESLIQGLETPQPRRRREKGQRSNHRRHRDKRQPNIRRDQSGERHHFRSHDDQLEPRRKGRLVQGRLIFPSEDKLAVSKHHVHGRQAYKEGTSKPRKRRVPVVLDDQTIFASPATPGHIIRQRATRKSPSKLPQRSPAVAADTGVKSSRAESDPWTEFDAFPIDFDIQPLPSGISCGDESFLGNGSVVWLLQRMETRAEETTEPLDAIASGDITLRPEMSVSDLAAVLPLLFDNWHVATSALITDLDQAGSVAGIFWLGEYLLRTKRDIQEDWESLLEACAMGLSKLLLLLEENALITKPAGALRDRLLRLQWSLFELACKIFTASSSGSASYATVKQAAILVLRQLFLSGFQKTIAPLKLIMRGESEGGTINDMSVHVWIAVLQTLTVLERVTKDVAISFEAVLDEAITATFALDRSGPIAADRIWFIAFGLCPLSQFDADGRIRSVFSPVPRWSLVRRAIGLIKVAHQHDAEETAHARDLRGRDRYVRTIMARCLRLSAHWKWHFDSNTFSLVTKDLAAIFKDRQYRNFPTEQAVDFPDFIKSFDMSLTAADYDKHESAFNLYLRLVCVAASDMISNADTIEEARRAESTVQRLIMSITPVSPVHFNRLFPPSARQLGQLINRYSTMIAACFFSPDLATWLLANAKRWAPFDVADFESRQITIRGLMYLGVACRHHQVSVKPVINRFTELFEVLRKEKDEDGQRNAAIRPPSRLEIKRTMVLVVTSLRVMIEHSSFDGDDHRSPTYPDPCILHEAWTSSILTLDLAKDFKSGLQVVATVQAFLDARAAALPNAARKRREARGHGGGDSLDEFSAGIDFSTLDLVALGGADELTEDPIEDLDRQVAETVTQVISPNIYRLLSDMLPSVIDEQEKMSDDPERRLLLEKVTKCWSDCAAVVVVDRGSSDGWTPYIGQFGQESWQRLGNEKGRLQVGLNFMLNVAKLDPRAFKEFEVDFVALLLQSLVTDRVTVEHHLLAAILHMPGTSDHVLLSGIFDVLPNTYEIDVATFLDQRGQVLEAIFLSIPTIMHSPYTTPALKSFIYRCMNLMVSAMITNKLSINHAEVLHHQQYNHFVQTTLEALLQLTDGIINASSVPGIKILENG